MLSSYPYIYFDARVEGQVAVYNWFESVGYMAGKGDATRPEELEPDVERIWYIDPADGALWYRDARGYSKAVPGEFLLFDYETSTARGFTAKQMEDLVQLSLSITTIEDRLFSRIEDSMLFKVWFARKTKKYVYYETEVTDAEYRMSVERNLVLDDHWYGVPSVGTYIGLPLSTLENDMRTWAGDLLYLVNDESYSRLKWLMNDLGEGAKKPGGRYSSRAWCLKARRIVGHVADILEVPEKHGGASLKTWIEESLDPYVS